MRRVLQVASPFVCFFLAVQPNHCAEPKCARLLLRSMLFLIFFHGGLKRLVLFGGAQPFLV